LNESEEAAIVRRCQAGDREAFHALVERYSGTLFGTAYLMTRDRELAKDAVQESLIQAWKHIKSLRLKGSLKAWLVRIVVNQVNQQRRKKRVPSVPLEESPEIAGDCNEVETVIIRHEEHHSLRQALDILPPEQREVLVLRYFSDLTVPEIASVTGKREGTIKSRINRALERLGKILRNEKYQK
jgi:RNA polymerase sigma-70 factor (ECF subfamily)